MAIHGRGYLGYSYDSNPIAPMRDSAAPKAKTVIGAVHRALRAATRNDHALIDRMLLPFDLSRAEDYRIFLNIHFTALLTTQADWRLQDSDDFERMLCCVRADLGTLGCIVTTPPSSLGASASSPKGLGIAYVVRGSRLGAAVLRRHVGATLPTTYLDFVPALSWAQFLIQLESLTDDPDGRDAAIRGARDIFNTFAAEFTLANGENSTLFSSMKIRREALLPSGRDSTGSRS